MILQKNTESIVDGKENKLESFAHVCYMIEGTRAKGRQRLKFSDSMKTLAGCRDVGEVVRLHRQGTSVG